jgi:Abnormal spindle-like microcephaly-assoc'd, ASPM-SPD-2-Hydin
LTRGSLLPLLLATAPLLTACASTPAPVPPAGAAAPRDAVSAIRLAPAAVPANVRCVRLTGQSSGRTVPIEAPVSPGTNTPVTFAGFQPGAWILDLEGFSQLCANVVASTRPTWVSAPVTTTLSPGLNDLGFVLRPAADVRGAIDFVSLLLTGPTGFGVLLIGNSETHSFAVKNVGTAPSQITIAVTGGIGNQFTAAFPCATLAPNESCTGTVTFQPILTGTTFAQLSVTGSPGGTVTTTVIGTGSLGPFP